MRSRFMPRSRAALVVALSGAGASPALASFYTLVSDGRRVGASVSVTNANSTESSGLILPPPPAFGADWTSNNVAQAVRSIIGAGASSGATQTSTFGAGGVINLLGSSSVSANTTNGGVSALATALNSVDLVFDVPAGTRVRLQSSASGNAVVRLISNNGSDLFSGSGFFDQTFGATRLRILADAFSSISIGPETTGNDGGAFSVILTIPTPGAAIVPASLLLAAHRRNRPSHVSGM